MNRTKSYMLFSVLLLLVMAASSFAQLATIITRETADPTNSGYAKWIKIKVKGSTLGGDNLNDNFAGVSFLVDLNFDGDNNETTPTSGGGALDTYEVQGDSIVTAPPGISGGARDAFLFVPIRRGNSTVAQYEPGESGYNTSIRPRVMLKNAGALRVGSFELSLQIDSGFWTCDDGIRPTIRHAYYYDDGSGSTAAAPGVHGGNMTPFDGYVDRIDLIWSEDMRTSNTSVTPSMFSGLVSTETQIHSLQSTGTWNGTARRFTIFVRSAAYNTGMSAIVTYVPPAGEVDRFREASTSQNLYYAESNSRALEDKAGPVIVSAKTKRAQRRQPLANALASKRIEVTFSEPVLYGSVHTGRTDFEIHIPAADTTWNPVSLVVAGANTATYEFQLTNNFTDGNVTGTIQFVADSVVTDLVNNPNGRSRATMPPGTPTPSRGALVAILDGILPNIIAVNTLDALLPDELITGGSNGWGYLDYVNVIFDHAMSPLRTSTEGFSVSGLGIAGVTGTVASWSASGDTVRLRLIATTTKVPNTGIIPTISYYNPGHPNGFMDVVNSGLCEDLYTTDVVLSGNNGLALAVRDKAGPAIIRAFTAGTNRIRVVFSEKVNTSGWPGTPAANTRLKWIVGGSYYNSVNVFYTGFSGANRDSVIYLNQTGASWAKTDSGAINFFNPNVVYDVASGSNGNAQYDNDLSLDAPDRTLMGSDVRIQRDNIAPTLTRLETVDLDYDGKLDHLRLVFDPESPVYPRRSFKPSFWIISGYDGIKQNLAVDMSVYIFPPAFVDPPINSFGDTVQVYISFNETTGSGPALTPYGGDTGDVLNAEVSTGMGFADWADNVMKRLPDAAMPVRDKAGPAIMSARSINTTQVEAFMSEDLMESSIQKGDFFLDMGLDLGVSWAFNSVVETNPGRVLLTVFDQTYWLPTQRGIISFAYGEGEYGYGSDVFGVYDLVSNVNHQTSPIVVMDHAASRFDINLAIEGSVYRGVPFQIEVIARDSQGNVDAGFPEAITLTSNLTQNEIDLPDGEQTLDEGIGYFTITSLKTTSNLRITIHVTTHGYDRYYSTSDAIVVMDPTIDAPNHLTVTDEPGDQGGFVRLTWDYSLNHPGLNGQPVINYYELFREKKGDVLFVGTIAAPDTNGTAMDSMRVKLHIGDNDSSRYWVRGVWDPNQAGTAALAAADGAGWLVVDQVQPVLLRSKGRVVQPVKRSHDATLAATLSEKLMSGSVMSSGRAIDNIPPKTPARFSATKSGVTVQLHWPQVTEGINNTLELFGVRYQIYSHGAKAYFDPDSEGELVITTQDTAFSYNGSELRKYFCVRAIDSDNESGIANRVGKYGFTLAKPTVPTQTVYNYLSLPLLNGAISKASQVAASITGVSAVFKIDSTTNRFSKIYIPGISSSKDDFEIPVGTPALVSLKSTAPSEWFYTGMVPDSNAVRFALRRDAVGKYNEITVPLHRSNITNALELAKSIGGVRSLFKLDPATNRFSIIYIPGITGQSGNFSVQCGEPVLINITNSAPPMWP